MDKNTKIIIVIFAIALLAAIAYMQSSGSGPSSMPGMDHSTMSSNERAPWNKYL